MPTLAQTDQQIAQARQNVQAQQQQVSQYQQKVAPTQTSLRTAVINPLMNMIKAGQQKILGQQAQQEVSKVSQDVEQFSKDFENYKRSEGGRLQWVRENNPKSSGTIYGRVAKGYALEPFAYVYDTPYGRVTDYSPRDKAYYREARNEARASGFRNNVEEYASVSNYFNKQFSKQNSPTTMNVSQAVADKIRELGLDKNVKLNVIQGITPQPSADSQVWGYVRNSPKPDTSFLAKLNQASGTLFGLNNQTRTNLQQIGSNIRRDFGIDVAQNKTQTFLTKAEDVIKSAITPKTSTDYTIERLNNQYNTLLNNYNQNIASYNANPNPTQADYNKLELQYNQIYNLGKNIESLQTGYAKAQGGSNIAFTQSMLTGFATSPIAVARMVTSPIQTTKETITGIANLPSQFAQAPSQTAGSLVGSTLGQVFIGEVAGIAGTTQTPRVTYKPKVTISKSLQDVVKVGEKDGVEIYLTKGGIVTRRVSPVTNRLISEVTTDVQGVSFLGSGDDLVTLKSRSSAGSISNRGLSVSPEFARLYARTLEAQSVGKFAKTPDALGNLKGLVRSTAQDYGQVRASLTPSSARFQFIKTRLPERFESFSAVSSRPLGTIETAQGVTSFDFNVGVSKIFKTRGKVKGYTRGEQKISSYLRKQDSRFKEINVDVGLSRTRSPTEVTDNFFKGGGDTKLTGGTPKEDLVKSVFEQEVSTISGVEKAKASKPVIRQGKTIEGKRVELPLITKEESKQVVNLVTQSPKERSLTDKDVMITPKISNLSRDGLIINPREREEGGYFFEGRFPTIRDKDLDKIKQPERQREGQAQQLRQKQQQAQQQLIRPVQKLVTPQPRPTTPRPRPEKIKVRTEGEDQQRKKRLTTKPFYKKPETFFAISKRKGKEIVVGASKTPFGAERLGKEYVLKTLGASLKVKSSSGRDILLRPSKEFAISQRDPFKLVQRKQAVGSFRGRLTSYSERAEIKALRNKKKFDLL